MRPNGGDELAKRSGSARKRRGECRWRSELGWTEDDRDSSKRTELMKIKYIKKKEKLNK